MDQRAKGSQVLLKARFPICVHGPVWEKIITVLLGLQRKTHERCWSIHIHPDISSHEGEKNFFLTSLFWVGHIKCVAVLTFVDSPLALLQGSYQTWQRGHHPMRENVVLYDDNLEAIWIRMTLMLTTFFYIFNFVSALSDKTHFHAWCSHCLSNSLSCWHVDSSSLQ